MSLVGNLEDLSLGDILQIISLSQKSGVLALSSDLGAGRIVFRSGMVQAACLKGHPNDLRELLVGESIIDPAGYDAALARSRDLGVPVEETLASEAGITRDQVDELITKAAETAILEMFSWPAGDFSFDVRSELDPDDPHLILPSGINAQYLAMEGLRVRDERARDADPAGEVALDLETDPTVGAAEDPLFGSDALEVDPSGETDSETEMETLPLIELDAFGADTPESEGATAADVLVAGVVERADVPHALTLDEIAEAMPLAEEAAPASFETPPSDTIEGAEAAPPAAIAAPDAPRDAREPSAALAEPPGGAADAAGDETHSIDDVGRMPVVLIDPDVTVLEWVRSAIETDFARVHMFQQADQGLTRIRQYLIRGATPLVLVSPETPIDPLSGIHGLGDFVKRLKAQSPRIVVLGLREDDDVAAVSLPGNLNGVLRRPPRRLLSEKNSADGAMASQVLARALLEILAQQTTRQGPAANDAASLKGLRDATAELQEASSRGEVLPVVLDFAAAVFPRVAILVVRDDELFAVAGRGIASLEVDPLEAADPVRVPRPAAGWLRRVLDTAKPVVGPPSEDADRLLLARLGGDTPKQAYVAPIESGGEVVAMLYADQAVDDAPMPDTHGIEVVLHHAGLALDRAALERALLEADAEAD